MKCSSVLSLIAGVLLAATPGLAQVRGVVEVSGVTPIGLSVAPIAGDQVGSRGVQARLSGHLTRSHWFSLVPYLGGPPASGAAPTTPPGASFVVSCAVAASESEWSLQGYVHSPDGSRQLGKAYRVAAGESDRALRLFADDVVKELTGVVGIASSTIAFTADHDGKPAIFSVAPDGGGERRLVAGKFECLFPRYAPGRSWLTYTAYPRDFPELMILDTRTGENRTVSARAGLNSFGAVSPDGTEIAATLSYEGNPELYILDFSGKVLRRLTNHRASDLSPAWSPDGERLAFVSDRSGSPAVYVVDSRGGGAPRRLTHGFDSSRYAVEPSWSPRGDYLAFSGRTQGSLDVWVLRLEDGEFFRVTEGGGDEEAPEWAPDNRHLVVATRRGKRRVLEVLDVRVPANRYEIPLPGKTGLRDPTWSQVGAGGAR